MSDEYASWVEDEAREANRAYGEIDRSFVKSRLDEVRKVERQTPANHHAGEEVYGWNGFENVARPMTAQESEKENARENDAKKTASRRAAQAIRDDAHKQYQREQERNVMVGKNSSFTTSGYKSLQRENRREWSREQRTDAKLRRILAPIIILGTALACIIAWSAF